jgi:hypothetical protein
MKLSSFLLVGSGNGFGCDVLGRALGNSTTLLIVSSKDFSSVLSSALSIKFSVFLGFDTCFFFALLWSFLAAGRSSMSILFLAVLY